ncbi:hypothetical protein [Paraburkholderia tagetis]|uniref:Uncharacterized protein n=1 Tax=Paraburkholderia tagetis TaxID=2913261 RepID=A0A9X1UDN1_9BURK|nr:hypothetical protein [Paraburkholderia tagetis]MCG5072265.1 hypothetical protein [Paraburkholderia tagetis]
MNNKRYRIVSDGTPRGTKIYEPDGREVDMNWITKVEWSVDAGGIGVARLTFINVEVDMVGGEAEQSDPLTATGE